jgi:hypothetical protein
MNMTLHPPQVSFLFNGAGDLSHTPGWENQDWEEVRCRKLPIRIRERHRVLTPHSPSFGAAKTVVFI